MTTAALPSARAKALAAEEPPRAVIFTGWSSNGGPPEGAEQMPREWHECQSRQSP